MNYETRMVVQPSRGSAVTETERYMITNFVSVGLMLTKQNLNVVIHSGSHLGKYSANLCVPRLIFFS